MSNYAFSGCPNCDVDDPSNFTVTHNQTKLTSEDTFIFFKTPDPDHSAILISCDNCEYSVARSIMMN